jgi:dTDP-4-amino-4,6-dideoxygalactose transaminase
MRFTDMNALGALAKKHNLKIIEDCAHAHGGQYEGRGAGSMGDLGCFSFQESKLMTAGEGGIVTTNSLAHYEHLQSQVNCGRASMTDEFKQEVLGSNYRMTEWQAAMLIGQIDMLPEFAQKRARAAARLTAALSSIDGVRALPPQAPITRETNYCYVFQYRNPRVPRDLFCAALEAEGIPCDGRFYEPVYRSPLFCASPEISPQLRDVNYATVRCEVSERAAYDEAVWLMQFLLIGEDRDVDDIAEAIAKVLRHTDELAVADPALAGHKALSRAQRPRKERTKNY